MSRGSPAAISQRHKEPPVPAARRGPQSPPPRAVQEPAPSPWWGPPIPGFLEGAQPPHLSPKCLPQHSGRSAAKARCSRAPSGSPPPGRDSPGKLVVTLQTPSQVLSASSPPHPCSLQMRFGQKQPEERVSRTTRLRESRGACSASLPAFLISKHKNQAVSLVLHPLWNPPWPLHQQRWFRKSRLIRAGAKPLLGQTAPSPRCHGCTCRHGKASSPRLGSQQICRDMGKADTDTSALVALGIEPRG